MIKKIQLILGENSIYKPPIFSSEIAESNSIDVEYVRFKKYKKKILGFVDFNKNKIVANGEKQYKQINFYIAYSLGVFFINDRKITENYRVNGLVVNQKIGNKQPENYKDKIIEEFAIRLLVPRKLLKKYQQFGSIYQLSDLFIVPKYVIRKSLLIYGFRKQIYFC